MWPTCHVVAWRHLLLRRLTRNAVNIRVKCSTKRSQIIVYRVYMYLPPQLVRSDILSYFITTHNLPTIYSSLQIHTDPSKSLQTIVHPECSMARQCPLPGLLVLSSLSRSQWLPSDAWCRDAQGAQLPEDARQQPSVGLCYALGHPESFRVMVVEHVEHTHWLLLTIMIVTFDFADFMSDRGQVILPGCACFYWSDFVWDIDGYSTKKREVGESFLWVRGSWYGPNLRKEHRALFTDCFNHCRSTSRFGHTESQNLEGGVRWIWHCLFVQLM